MKNIQVLKVTQTKKKISIKLDNNEKLSIYPETYTDFLLYPNKFISEEDICLILEKDKLYDGIRYVYTLLGKRAYSSYQLKEKLLNKGFVWESIKKIITYLEENHLINDQQLMAELIEYYLEKGYGENFIKYKLNSLGFPEHLLMNIEIETNKKSLTMLINKLMPQIKGLSKNETLIKLKMKLLSKGFLENDVDEALNKVTFKANHDEINISKEFKNIYERLKSRYTKHELFDKIKEELLRKGYSYSLVNEKIMEAKCYENDF